MTQDKLLDKLSKIKRHADSAKAIGSEAEAQAFAEMLQRLLLEHKLEMSDIEFETMEKESPVEEWRIDYAKYDMRPKKARIAWAENLASIIARAHFCRILVHIGSSRITLVGRKEDCAVAEYLYITLYRAAEKISGRAYDAYRNEERKKLIEQQGEAGARGSMPWTFGFRESFMLGFIDRLRKRLEDRTRQAGASSSTALVRVNKSEAAVAEFMKGLGTKTASALSRVSRINYTGLDRGRAAADRIDLDGKAIVSAGNNRGRLS